MLTAKDTILDKVTGLDAGADDYETSRCCRTLLLGCEHWTALTLVERRYTDHGRFKTPSDKSDRGTGAGDQLSVREFQMMEYLMRHLIKFYREQIEQALWEWGTEPESNAVTTLVRRLRQRLQAVSEDWLETVYGMGYRLNPPNAS